MKFIYRIQIFVFKIWNILFCFFICLWNFLCKLFNTCIAFTERRFKQFVIFIWKQMNSFFIFSSKIINMLFAFLVQISKICFHVFYYWCCICLESALNFRSFQRQGIINFFCFFCIFIRKLLEKLTVFFIKIRNFAFCAGRNSIWTVFNQSWNFFQFLIQLNLKLTDFICCIFCK